LTLTNDTQIDAWVEKAGIRDSAVVTKQFTLAWRTLSDVFPAPINSHAAAVVDGTIWVAGGYLYNGTNDIVSDKVYSYIPGESPVEQATKKLPEARRGMSMVVYNGDLYVIGGAATTSANNDDVLVLDLPSATNWTIRSDAFETRINSQAVLYNGNIYLPFGYGSSSTLDNWGTYSITGFTSASLLNTLSPRQGSAATLLGSVVFSVGGTSGNENKIHRYDVSAGGWLADESLGAGESVNWAQGSAITIGTRIVVFSGTNTYIRETNGTWRKDTLPIPREVYNSSAAFLNGKVYITGGTNAGGTSPVNTILEFTPP
jgi:N-acetylneuraminic acid mutarotase